MPKAGPVYGVWYVVRACDYVSVFDAKYLWNYGDRGYLLSEMGAYRKVAGQNRSVTWPGEPQQPAGVSHARAHESTVNMADIGTEEDKIVAACSVLVVAAQLRRH